MPISNEMERAYALLAEDNFEQAKDAFSYILKEDPSLSDAYLGRLLAELEITSENALKSAAADILECEDFQKAIMFSDGERKKELCEIAEGINERRRVLSLYDSDFLENIYRRATSPIQTSESYAKSAEILRSIGGYRDSSILAEKYQKVADELSVKEAEEKRLRDIRDKEEREAKRKKSDSIQIKIYSVAIVILSLFLIFLICYNTFLKDFIKKQQLLDEIYPATYDELTVMDEENAPWFSITKDGVLSFDKEKYHGDGNIIIPDVFENTLVKSLKENAFYNYDSIKSVVISNYISEIEDYTFYGCTSLKEIVFSNSIESIGDGAFAGCSALEELVLPDSLLYIGNLSFQNCSSIRTITMPASTLRIGTRAFSECSAVDMVIYDGYKSDFEKITIGVDNGPFDVNNENINFKFKSEE